MGHLVDEWTGEQHPISGIVVIGSDPGSDADVSRGAATVLRVDGPEVDEVHVRVRVEGGRVTVQAVNDVGAWVQQTGGPLTPLGSSPVALNDGAHLRVGTRTLVFRAAPGSGH